MYNIQYDDDDTRVDASARAHTANYAQQPRRSLRSALS